MLQMHRNVNFLLLDRSSQFVFLDGETLICEISYLHLALPSTTVCSIPRRTGFLLSGCEDTTKELGTAYS